MSNPQSGVGTVHAPQPIGAVPTPRPGQVPLKPQQRPARPAKSGFTKKGKH